MIKIIVSLIIAYISNIIDYFQTVYAVQLVGIGVEANQVIRFLLENNCAWIAKLIVAPMSLTIVAFIAQELNRLSGIRELKIISWCAYLVAAIYLAVVVNNFITLFRLGAF